MNKREAEQLQIALTDLTNHLETYMRGEHTVRPGAWVPLPHGGYWDDTLPGDGNPNAPTMGDVRALAEGKWWLAKVTADMPYLQTYSWGQAQMGHTPGWNGSEPHRNTDDAT
jgi:hypothetical protein